MEDRLTRMRTREAAAVGAVGFIVAVTVAWWSLALWPLPADAPGWLARTRLVCFGAEMDGLPTAAGWILLVGEPIAMVAALLVIGGSDVRAGLTAMRSTFAGRATLRAAGLVILVAASAASLRVARASAGGATDGAAARRAPYGRTPLDLPAPPLRLVDQRGDTVSLADYRGRTALVTFAFGHCETVCPLLVRDALAAARSAAGSPPVVLVVTLDPWRDTPSRLAGIAEHWQLTGEAHVLGGGVGSVRSVLDAWGVPRSRDGASGDITHVPAVYVVNGAGRIAYSVAGGAEAILAAIRAL